MPKADDAEQAWDATLLAVFAAAGVRSRRLSAEEHRERESAWRRVYEDAFRLDVRIPRRGDAKAVRRVLGDAYLPHVRIRHRKGAKAVYEYMNEPARQWSFVPFLANVPGTPMHVLPLRLSPFECEGPVVELDEFKDVEFFVSPPDLSWTFVRTHEGFILGGPYFVRAEWVEQADIP
jgi:hypothetical protein